LRSFLHTFCKHFESSDGCFDMTTNHILSFINKLEMIYSKHLMMAAFLLCVGSLFAQPTKAPDNWFNLDAAKDGVNGVSTEVAYKTILAGKKSQTVIVAVLDSGVDYMHEDLKDVMWVNPGEIAGNGKDDDKNGYIDDIHGWSFIGGKKGNVNHDSYEMTREVKRLSAKYENMTGAAKDKKEYAYYQKVKAAYDERKAEMEGQLSFVKEYFGKLEMAVSKAKGMGLNPSSKDDIAKLEGADKESAAALSQAAARGMDLTKLDDEKKEAMEYFDSQLSYGLNLDYNPRDLVGDNYNDVTEKYYGSNDCKGPDASHGTHVSGIIAASRNNGVGMNGVADNVRIMSVRCVPDGDERDKDVANAIIYAVDNGASIINMSFGKGYSPNKDVVDAAVKYALKNDVLLVHAAGNDSENNDTDPNFPNDGFAKKGMFKPKVAKNWLEIGALSWKADKNRTAKFSNYGKKNVDVFSPGVAIYSTTPENQYASFQGTSMAAPCAAGVAAAVRSRYPELSAAQIRNIMISSNVQQQGKVYKPGTTEEVMLSDISVGGGTVNLVTMATTASKTKGKGKSAKWKTARSGKTTGGSKIVTP
jgi:cell wall-associated protease